MTEQNPLKEAIERISIKYAKCNSVRYLREEITALFQAHMERVAGEVEAKQSNAIGEMIAQSEGAFHASATEIAQEEGFNYGLRKAADLIRKSL